MNILSGTQGQVRNECWVLNCVDKSTSPKETMLTLSVPPFVCPQNQRDADMHNKRYLEAGNCRLSSSLGPDEQIGLDPCDMEVLQSDGVLTFAWRTLHHSGPCQVVFNAVGMTETPSCGE